MTARALDVYEYNGIAPPSGNNAMAKNVHRPTTTANRRPITLKRLLDGPPPSPPSLTIDRFLLAADVNFLGGDGDAGKSTTMFVLGVVTTLGRPLFGTLPVRKPGPVVLIVPEDGEAVARHHSDAAIAGLEGVTDEERAILARDLHVVGDDRPINLLTDTRELYERIADIEPAVVIAEPMASLIGGESENDESVAEAVCSNLRRDIARPLGAAVLMAGHLRKPSREGPATAASVHDLKGSSGWANHSRIVWMVSKPKGSTLITYRLVKSNRLKTGIEHQATLAIEANPDNEAHWLTCRLTDANLGASSDSLTPGKGRRLNDNEIAVLSALDDQHAPDTRLSWSRWHKLSGITNENTFKSIRSRVLDAQLANARPNGRKTRNGSTEYDYGITAEGRQALATGWALDVQRVRG